MNAERVPLMMDRAMMLRIRTVNDNRVLTKKLYSSASNPLLPLAASVRLLHRGHQIIKTELHPCLATGSADPLRHISSSRRVVVVKSRMQANKASRCQGRWGLATLNG